MFWRNWSWPVRILSVALVGLVAAVLFPVFARVRDTPSGHGSCRSNLMQIGLGLIEYTQDYDEKFPPVVAHGSAFGWADALQPYVKSTRIFQCPQQNEPGQTDPRLSGTTDYWFNARLSKRELKAVKEPGQLIAGGDGNDGTDITNARYSIFALPPKWVSDTDSPLYRHLGTANYLFADGHVTAQRVASLRGTFTP